MAKDLNFNKVINVLKEIHKERPDLRFGMVVQLAFDQHKKQKNTDFHDVGTKAAHTALTKYKDSLVEMKKKSRLNKNDS